MTKWLQILYEAFRQFDTKPERRQRRELISYHILKFDKHFPLTQETTRYDKIVINATSGNHF